LQHEKQELTHYNANIASQQKAYEELRSQLAVIGERSSKMQAMNEMLIMQQQKQHEELMESIRE